MPTMPYPVVPFRGYRTIDAHGGGAFGAPRGAHEHKGQDYIAVPGDICVAIIGGNICRIGCAYDDDPSTPLDESVLGSIHIMGTGEWDGLWVKLLYAQPHPELALHQAVKAAGIIAHAQNRAEHVKDKARGPMINHIHSEVRSKQPNGSWLLVNPVNYHYGGR